MTVERALMSAKTGLSGPAIYVEDVFSASIYSGTAATQTISNGIDLAGKGGLIWTKSRNTVLDHVLIDTVRGGSSGLSSTSTAGAGTAVEISSFTSSGYGLTSASINCNRNGYTYASWTFAKASKFFDIVTYTGTGVARTVSHNLGSVPGCIIVKRLDATGGNWQVYHTSLASGSAIQLNYNLASSSGPTIWNSTTPTTTTFTVGTDVTVNASGVSYVAYLFANNAGGFGSGGAQSIVSCGSFTTDASGASSVSLGWEPQLLICKNANATGSWYIIDSVRGMGVGIGVTNDSVLLANGTTAEAKSAVAEPSATGFTTSAGTVLAVSSTYIYIAIRRPMKAPTSGSSVFNAVTRAGTDATSWVASGAGFAPDMTIMNCRTASLAGAANAFIDRLRRATEHIQSSSTAAEGGGWEGGHLHNADGYEGTYSLDANYYNGSANGYVDLHFRRATGFFDIVCFTGSGANTGLPHNLGVAPELIITKARNTTSGWGTYTSAQFGLLNTTGAFTAQAFSLSASTFEPLAYVSGTTYVSYLFASLAGVSKIGTYVGNGTSQTIDCGFAVGARFILIKRTDSTGDWYVWDSARGITASTDPHISLNSSAVEVTTHNSISPQATGFGVIQETGANINVTSAAYLYFAIA